MVSMSCGRESTRMTPQALEQGVVHPVAAGQRTGVAHGKLGAELGLSGFQGDQRLAGLHRLGAARLKAGTSSMPSI